MEIVKMETVYRNQNADRFQAIDGMQSFEECIDSIYNMACNIKRDQTSITLMRMKISSMRSLLDLLELYVDKLEMIEDRQARTCPHCGTVWKDYIAALICPCMDQF